MSRITGTQRIAGASALALAAAMGACSEPATSSRRGENVAVAETTPIAPPAALQVSTADSPSTTADERARATQQPVAAISYSDAESVYRKGRYADAAELFGAYAAAHPRSVSGQYMLGLSAWKAGDRGRAQEALLRAVELDSSHVKARTNLSRVLLEQGRAADALPHMEKAVALAPSSHEVWRVLGNVRSELGRSAEAIEAYRHALIRNEQDAWSMNNYGLVLIQQGRYEEAVPPLARAVELVPGSPVFLNNLGVALERTGELGAAASVFAAAVEADSTFTKAKISLDRLQARLGEAPITEPDLSAFAADFIAELQRWRIARPEHEGC
jgi:Tfp pilus assembly protein PilF